MIKNLINRIKIYRKGIAIAAEKSVAKRRWKIKNLESLGTILGDSIMKDVKGCELTDESNKVVVKSFRGATTSQMKWYVKPTTEQNRKNIISHYGTNDINDDSDTQNIAE